MAAAVLAVAAWGCGSDEPPLLASEPEIPDAATDGPAHGELFCPDGGCPPHCAAGELSCDGTCIDPHSDSAHCGSCDEACASDETCTRGACVLSCLDAETVCGSECANMKTDHENCGRCGQVCDSFQDCNDGSCH